MRIFFTEAELEHSVASSASDTSDTDFELEEDEMVRREPTGAVAHSSQEVAAVMRVVAATSRPMSSMKCGRTLWRQRVLARATRAREICAEFA